MKNLISEASPVLRDLSQAAFEKSGEYAGFSDRHEWLVLSVDRVLAACRATMEFDKLDEMTLPLLGLCAAKVDGHSLDEDRNGERWLERHSEHWLKAIWWLTDPADYAAAVAASDARRLQGKNPRLNLFEALVRLDLLSVSEANLLPNQCDLITDPGRRAVFLARHARNSVHLGGKSDYVQPPGVLAIALLLAPLIKKERELRIALNGLFTRSLNLTGERLQLLRSVSEAKRNHLRRFAGRQKWLEQLQNRLTATIASGGYLLLVGPEGQGKSALCSKLAEMLATELRPLGADASRVSREAPWLPAVVFHLGKQSRNPRDVVHLITAQANALVLREIRFTDEPARELYEAERGIGFRHTARTALVGDVPYSSAPLVPTVTTSLESAEHYREILFTVMNRLVEERGSACVILDALDEISRVGEGLRFLPDPLPRGAAFLLTVRSNLGLDTWLRANRSPVEIVALDNLGRDDVPLLTGVEEIGPTEKGFNDEVFDRTKGWAYMLSAIGFEVERHGGDYKRVELDDVSQALLERQAAEWTTGKPQDALAALLPVLALFEPCTPISIDALQGYLLHSGWSLRRADVVALLRQVGHQLEGLTSNSVKLAQAVFAEHIRQHYLSAHDHKQCVDEVLRWLAAEEAVKGDVVASFISYVPRSGERTRPRDAAERVAHLMTEAGRAESLYEVASALLSEEKGELGERFLRAAAALRHPRAMYELGVEMLSGKWIKKDESEGESLLRRASDAGSLRAMARLAGLLFGRSNADVEEAQRFLRRAADGGDKAAMRMLGGRLLDGDGFDRDEVEGEAWLSRAVEAGSSSAALDLANRYLHGEGVQLDRGKGLTIARAAANRGNVAAMFLVGVETISSGESNSDDAVIWLQRAIARGEHNAALFLAHCFLLGHGVESAPDVAADMLRKVIESDAPSGFRGRAMALLGDAVLEGTVSGPPESGIEMLQAAMDAGDAVALTEWGNRLIKGDKVPQDLEAGIGLLRRAAEAGHAPAMFFLADKLFDAGDLVEGERWLRRAAESRHHGAMTSLGRRLVLGEQLEVNRDEGFRLLREAAQAGYRRASLILGQNLEDITEAAGILRGVATSDPVALLILATRYYGASDYRGAAESFYEAYKTGSKDAANNLAYMVRRGEVPADVNVPACDVLLETGVREKHVFSLINQALSTLRGGVRDSWCEANDLIAECEGEDCSGAVVWWHDLAKTGDCEGHLVIWLMVRNKKADDPDGMSLDERLACAQRGGCGPSSVIAQSLPAQM